MKVRWPSVARGIALLCTRAPDAIAGSRDLAGRADLAVDRCEKEA